MQPTLDVGERGARILDIVIGMADFFFADPGIRIPSVLFAFALEIELGTVCSFHDGDDDDDDDGGDMLAVGGGDDDGDDE